MAAVYENPYVPMSAIEARRRYALGIMQQATDSSPTKAGAIGAIARALQGAIGGYVAGQADKQEQAGTDRQAEFLASALGGGQSPAPVSPTEPQVSPMGGAVPRGLRNNNPLNIEAGGFTQGQPGFAGSDGRFARFSSPEQGISAANKLLDTYQNKYGLNTPAGIVGRWAPANDGNNVSSYAANVAAKLGIGPNDPITPEMRPQLIAAMAGHENGRPMDPQIVAQALQQNQGAAQPPGAPPMQMAQAQPSPVEQQIMQGLRSRDPFVQKTAQSMAAALLQKRLTQQPEYAKGDNGLIFEKHTGKIMVLGGGYRPVTDPKERAKFGIPPSDNRPYQVGPGNKLVNPPPENRINIDQRAPNTYDTKMATHFADANIKMIEGATQARSKMAMVDRLSNLLSDPSIYTGTAGGKVFELKRAAKSMGFDVGDLGGAEAANAISNMFALELRNPSGGAGMPGAMSDKDREFLQAIPPGLNKTPQGNKIMADYLRKTAQRSIQVDKFRQQYIRKHKRIDENFYAELSDWSDQHPLFSEADKAAVNPSSNIDDLLKKYGPQ